MLYTLNITGRYYLLYFKNQCTSKNYTHMHVKSNA